ncbi:MAG TPA: DivIVA domain-containing protein [Bacteroidota bacterium]|nr:DivIVA domain-containing protein [Bacteroidota bacterium]
MDPNMVAGRTFRRKFRGADSSEVNSFLREVADYCRLLVLQKDQLEQRVASLEAEVNAVRTLERSIQQTLVQAQETSARTVDAAKKEADLIRQEAAGKAARTIEEAYAALTGVKEATIILTAKRDAIRERLKLFLQSELDMIRSFDSGEPSFSPERVRTGLKESDEMREIEEIIKTLGDEQ